jgi:phenylpropionate dioxygenase-like ring-hydroxylating dioxygenase large terminal subunit
MSDKATELYERFYTQNFPWLKLGPVSTESYVSPEYFELEKSRIFQKSWLLFGHESDIPNAGDCEVKDIAVLGMSIIVARGHDGVIRAFHNVCRHRGNKLICNTGRNHAKAFVCALHGWSFGLDGRLRGVPEQERFFDFDKAQWGLKPITVDIWNSFIFIHAETSPKETLKEYLGTLGADMQPYPANKLRLISKYSTTVKANWKVALNVFQEAYHVATVHTGVVPTQVAGPKSRAVRLANFRIHGNHRCATLRLNPESQPAPVEALAAKFSRGFSNQLNNQPPEQRWPGLNPGNVPNFGFDINVIFPSSFIDTAQGWCFTYEFWPVSVDETFFVSAMYFDSAKTWSERIGQELTVIQLREALKEDLQAVETTQEGLMTGAIDEIVLSDQELAIRHQHHVVDSIVRQ